MPQLPVANGTAGLNNITVNVAISTPGVHGPGGGADVPSGPGDCRPGVHEEIVIENATLFDGTMIDYGTTCDSMAHQTIAGYWLFTGSIAGCTGSGTVTFPWYGEMDEDPIAANPNGEVFHAHDILGTPTNSTGFAGIVDARMDAEFYLNPVGISGHGTLTGYILCK